MHSWLSYNPEAFIPKLNCTTILVERDFFVKIDIVGSPHSHLEAVAISDDVIFFLWFRCLTLTSESRVAWAPVRISDTACIPKNSSRGLGIPRGIHEL